MSQSTDKNQSSGQGPSDKGADPLAQAYAAYEQLEGRLSTAMDQLVATNGFAEIFTTSATNIMAIMRIVNGGVDQAVRATRLAVRQDITGLARQLARTEDKLERLLQAVEQLEERLAASEAASPAPAEAAAKPAAAAPAAAQPAAAESAAGTNGSAPKARRTAAATKVRPTAASTRTRVP
jgi:BMFP domain-containing protein YqiC